MVTEQFFRNLVAWYRQLYFNFRTYRLSAENIETACILRPRLQMVMGTRRNVEELFMDFKILVNVPWSRLPGPNDGGACWWHH